MKKGKNSEERVIKEIKKEFSKQKLILNSFTVKGDFYKKENFVRYYNVYLSIKESEFESFQENITLAFENSKKERLEEKERCLLELPKVKCVNNKRMKYRRFLVNGKREKRILK